MNPGPIIYIDVTYAVPNTVEEQGQHVNLGMYLREIPLILDSIEDDYQYELIGFVNAKPGHFVSYSRRNGSWWLYNDLNPSPQNLNIGPNDFVRPEILCYVIKNKDQS